MSYVLDSVGGSCPVQAYGRHVESDRPFYFRFRSNVWTIEVGDPGEPLDPGEWRSWREWLEVIPAPTSIRDPAGVRNYVATGEGTRGEPLDGFMDDDDVIAILDAHFGAAVQGEDQPR